MIIKDYNGKNRCFIHIPRTSGTYLEELISRRYGIELKWPMPSLNYLFGFYKEYEGKFYVLQHLTFQEIQSFIKQGLISSDLEFFTIVRNPYDRLISLYKYWGEAYRFGNFDFFLTELESLSLHDYHHSGIITERKASDLLKSTEVLSISDFKYHFLPQVEYLCDREYRIKAEIFKFSAMSKLSLFLDINPKFSNNKREENIAFLSAKQIIRIQNLYYKDFEVLGYDLKYTKDSEL